MGEGFLAFFSKASRASSHGIILGFVLCSGVIGGSTGSVLAGHIFDITNSYRLAFILLAVVSATGLILTTSLKPLVEGGDK